MNSTDSNELTYFATYFVFYLHIYLRCITIICYENAYLIISYYHYHNDTKCKFR